MMMEEIGSRQIHFMARPGNLTYEQGYRSKDEGGNSYYKDSFKHAEYLESKAIEFVDCGTSGGV